MEYFFTNKAPKPGFYSQAISVNPVNCDLLFLAGQTGNIPEIEGEPVIVGGLGPQTIQALKNIVAVVEAAGSDVNHIIGLQVLLKDSEEIGKARQQARTISRKMFNAAYMSFFIRHGISEEKKNAPVRTMAWVSEIPLEYPLEDTLVEITAIAAIPKKKNIRRKVLP